MCSGASATYGLLLRERDVTSLGQAKSISKHMPNRPYTSIPCLLEEYPPWQAPRETIAGVRIWGRSEFYF
jgi:hypothetical protein